MPIVLASVDMLRKEIEMGGSIDTTGNIDVDMRLIKGFYAGKVGVNESLG